jgi:predicted dienelactone hydrolase
MTLAPRLMLSLLMIAPLAQAFDNRIDTIRPDAPALAAYGTQAVGVTTLSLVNPKQLDILKAKAGEPTPSYDRPLTVELWYPAIAGAPQTTDGQYQVMTRGKLMSTLTGKALREAQPLAGKAHPLVIISHGYPGNRFLLSHLAENLASKGYVVASIDHTDSTYGDQAAFASTLLNRPLDQLFVLNELAKLNQTGQFKGLINSDNTALIGYSMGGYGVVNTLGGGFTAASVAGSMAPPNKLLEVRQAGNPAHTASIDPRIKAAIAIAPWGWNRGFWDAAGLAAIKTPIFYIAGSLDDVSGYAPGVRNLYEASVNAPRFLLTFDNANHNAAAPIPAPTVSWQAVAHMKNIPAEHYLDPVWDTTRMNNIAQHFATAFLGKFIKGDSTMDAFLNLTPNAKDGKWSAETNGDLKADHSYWKGFPNRTAAGLRLEQAKPN